MTNKETKVTPMQAPTKIRKICPCGEAPTDLMIHVPQGSKYGIVSGNCCGTWNIEFKAGFPKDNQDLAQKAEQAWDEAPRKGLA